jgi:serine/threonine protein kinase/class 3 adenylate cyclase
MIDAGARRSLPGSQTNGHTAESAPATTSPARGLGGRYALQQCFAEGGMAKVWRAFDTQLERPVAVKMLRAPHRQSDEVYAGFESEALAIARLQHPHVVQIHDFGVDEGEPFMVMELLEGEDLGARLERLGRLPLGAVGTLVHELASALTAAHAVGLVHRDLKPGNVFFARTATGEVVKVLDFGLAYLLDRLGAAPESPAAPGGARVTTSAFAGTPHYMSPEQVLDSGVDHHSDLWSLGVLAYHALTGQHPFQGQSLRELLLAICTARVTPPTTLVPGLPPEVNAFFEQALAKGSNQRFQSAREMAVAFGRLLDADSRPTKILFVDDEPDLADLVKQRFRRELRQSVYEFVFAGDGGTALAELERHPDIEVICTDIRMPQLDGLSLLGRVRETRPGASVIVVSAYGDMANVRTAMNRGAFDFVTKPIDLDDLDVTLRKTVDHTRERRQRNTEHDLFRLLSRGLVGEILPRLWSADAGAIETSDTTVAVVAWRGLRVPSEPDERPRWQQELTQLFEVIVGEAGRQGGRVDRLDGEQVLLAFRDHDHLRRALQACDQIRRAIGQRGTPATPAFAIGIGSGPVTLTALGSRAVERLECLPVGDPVTTARQLSQLAGDGEILLPADLATALDGEWTCRPADPRAQPAALPGLSVVAVERRPAPDGQG